MKSISYLLFCLMVSVYSYANHPKIDSLKVKLSTEKIDSIKVRLYNEIASQFIDVSYDSILPYSQKALYLSNQINYPKGKGVALKNQATYYFYAGNQVESKKKMDAAISVFTEISDVLNLAKTYQNYGILLKNYGETLQSIEKYNLAIRNYEKINNQQGIVDNLINKGNVFQNQGKFDEAQGVFEKAKEVNLKLKNKNTQASILTGEGLIADKKGDFKKAKEKLSESLQLFKELGQERLVLGMYNNLANISRKQGDYLLSIEYFENALASAKKMNNPQLQGIILNNLANTYLDISDDDKAATLYKEAIAIIKDLDKATYASLLSNLAIIQTNQGEFKTALHSLDTTLSLYREQGNRIYEANTLSNIAYNHYELKNFTQAKNYYQKAQEISSEMGDQYTLLSIYSGLGKVYLEENRLDSAYFYSEKAFSISKEINALPEESKAAELLYKISKSEGKSKKALEYLEIFTTLKDSLFDQEKSKALGKLESELGFKSIKEQMELEKQNETLENDFKINQRENFIMGLASASLALIIVVILLVRIKINKTKANYILNQKNKEIETQNIKLNESNLQKNKLFSLISHDLRSPVNSLSQVFEMYIKQQITEEEFKNWIPEINKDLSSTRLLIDNLLKWASESLNESFVEKRKLHLHSEVESLYTFFNTSLKEKNITFENKVPQGFQIFMDSNALKLVIRNLISNAIKFCDAEDNITISATHQGGFDRICIQDTGVGMPTEISKSLFSNTSVISSVGTRKEEGKGIGTVLCKTFVEENGGSIWVDYSEENQGTRICFEIPHHSLDVDL